MIHSRIPLFFLLAAISLATFRCSNESSGEKEKNQNIAQYRDTITIRDTIVLNLKDTIVVRDTLPWKDTIQPLKKPGSLSADKMNIMYIGVENPITIDVPGISSNEVALSVTGGGGQLKKSGANSYIATFTQPGEIKFSVSFGTGRRIYDYRVKRIPDPQARLSKSIGGVMGSGEFKAQGGIGTYLDNFDFEAACQVTGFIITYIPKRQDPIEMTNIGARFNAQSYALIQKAKPGDIYLFTNVKAKCPGDIAARRINSLAIIIK